MGGNLKIVFIYSRINDKNIEYSLKNLFAVSLKNFSNKKVGNYRT